MRDIILGGLLLPLRLYFKPTTFGDEVAAIAPDLPREYNLWRARRELRDPDFRRGLGRVVLQALVALLWVPALLGPLAALGYPINWIAAALGVVGGVVAGVAVGVTNGQADGLMIGVTSGVTGGMAGGMAGAIAFSVGLGLAIGMIVGVVLSIGIGMVFVGMAVAWLASDVASNTTVDMMGGAALGVELGMMAGTMSHIRRDEAGSIGPSAIFSVTVGVALSVGIGLNDNIVDVVALAVSAILAATHLWLFPFQVLLSALSRALVRFRPALAPALWRVSPVRWDETILLPLPGLAGLLVALSRVNPQLGQDAFIQVAGHHFQHRAAPHPLVQLARDDALLVTSLAGLAAYDRGLGWLFDETRLPAAEKSLLLRMRDVSREVASAQESDSATNRVRRLSTAAGMIEPLHLQPGLFGPALARWTVIVAAGLEQAQQQQRHEEPIPQVYIMDGRPIHPAGRPEDALPFKGRAALFRRLEAALGGAEGERATFVLHGQRRAGKTSALLQLSRRLGSRMAPAFLDMQSPALGGAKDAAGLLDGLAAAVVEETRRHRDLKLPPLDRAALAKDPYPAFDGWLHQLERALGEHTLLLCLDEFEALEEAIRDGRLDTRILDTIRSVVQHRRRIAVLLSGSHQVEDLPPRWVGALITTTTLPISYLDETDARELIERPVASFPAIYAPAAVDRIVGATRCQPYLVQLLCALLVERMNTARCMPPESFVGVEDVDAAIPLALERGQNYFIDLWRTQTGGDSARRVLEALARAPGERLDRDALRGVERDEAALRDAVGALLRRELIERDGDSYRVAVPLVAAYVRKEALI